MKRAINRLGSVCGEFLEPRCLLNAAPVGVADEYAIEKDTVLVADRPISLESFATDFSDGILGPHLEGDGFAVQDGRVHRVGASDPNDRAYIRTVDANYLDVDFRYEVSLTTSDTPDTAIYFVGIGLGEGDEGFGGGEPQDSLFLRIHGSTTAGGYVSISNSPASDLEVIGNLSAPGTHRVRIDKLGNAATFSIDQDYDGTFMPDVSHVVTDIAAVAPFLTAATTHLFFGTAVEPDYFDDFSVEVLALPGVLSNDTDADGDTLSAELVSGPSSGTLDFSPDGTFRYEPSQGFVGTDSFVYIAHDAELASDPTEVTILVSSTNLKPVGVPDHYEIPQDTVLAATRPRGPDGFAMDFEDGSLFPYLEGAGFVVQDGVVRRQGAANHNDRAYLRTRQADLLNVDFRYEISLTTSLVDKDAIYFVGIGSGRGEASNNEPSDSIHLAILGPNTSDERVDVVSHPLGHPTTTIGYLHEPGTHRIRLQKTGNSLSFFIDEHFEGKFVADISYTIEDLATAAPALSDMSTHLFFGTGIEEDYFDDLSVEYLTPAGVLANDTDADGDVLTAELLTEPAHGSLVFESDGTFTYTPEAGFFGTDTFTYRVNDGEAASEPTEVTIEVTSTNFPPVASPDHYEIVRGEMLQTTSEPAAEVHSQQVFFTDFDDGIPAQFTGTNTWVPVGDFAGLGTAENVFGGSMLRNKTGNSVPFSPMIPTRLVLSDLPEHESIDMRFLLAAIDSWDGNTPAPDIFAVAVDGEVIFVETLDGTDLADQSYVPPAGALLAHNEQLGFIQQYGDAAYDMSRDARFRNVPHTSDSATIEWFTYGEGWSTNFGEDESWGIDNVEVLVNSTVHAPLGVLANDLDAPGQALSAIVETEPAHGSVSLAPDGSFTYTPDEGFVGLDAFAYRATDGIAQSEPAWVTIEVRPESRPLIAVDDEYNVPAAQPLVVGQRTILRDIGTGFSEGSGEKLHNLAKDLDYTIVASPNDLYTGDAATVMPGEQPIGGYLPDGDSGGSRWIGVLHESANEFSVEPGDYALETSIVLSPDFAAQTAFIEGLRVAADNSLVSLSVNGVPVLTSGVVGFAALTDLGDVGLGAFRPGVNVLRFVVHNDNGGRNPLGLRVEGRVVAQASPAANEATGLLANDFLTPSTGSAERVVSVGGTSDLWLAGMPAGTQASFGDRAPAHSPALVPGLSLRAGDVLRFDATGLVGNTHNLQAFPTTDPDGGIYLHHESGAEHGLSNVIAPLNSLVGVFLGPSQPNFFAPPPTLDFRTGGNVPGGVNYTRLMPRLQQVFFIGNGLTDSGVRQEIVVPEGATRLYLGTMDGFRWADNVGRFDVQVLGGGDPVGVVVREQPARGELDLMPDGSFTYTPDGGFKGVDRFTYEISNRQGDADLAEVVLRVGGAQLPELPGDFNGNDLVEQEDLDLVLANWGKTASPPPARWINDLPSDIIDQDELDAVLANWGATSAASAKTAPTPLPLHQRSAEAVGPAAEIPYPQNSASGERDMSNECVVPAKIVTAPETLPRTVYLDMAFDELARERQVLTIPPPQRKSASLDAVTPTNWNSGKSFERHDASVGEVASSILRSGRARSWELRALLSLNDRSELKEI